MPAQRRPGSTDCDQKAALDKAIADAAGGAQEGRLGGGEWRDTAKMIKEAEEAGEAGDFAKGIKLANEAQKQGELGYEQAVKEKGAGLPRLHDQASSLRGGGRSARRRARAAPASHFRPAPETPRGRPS